MTAIERGCRRRIKYGLYRVRLFTEGLTADWEGTFWKNKKAVRNEMLIAQGELNRLYDELDKITGKKNERQHFDNDINQKQ